ncbi:MAG: translational GTPase TypA [Planctomycetia bacterium]|nr:translational GTPase TypA [Planctomycetia bacterium]MCC7316129.1 translational GTPase TypA [Planctomycetota bacterium]OQZ06311.1 MAG: GTP-binding protein TypA [Planctomycetes bacterium UTPLA1]
MQIRNVAIIAHVDHGKTSLVDCLLRQSGNFREGTMSGDLIMDSNPQERERGITIFAKNCAIHYKDYKINIIDTPGHADFGGEVERVLKMADGCLLVVDAFEGPMPQTRFVLKKAFEYHLKPILVINKIDRPDARPKDVLDETHELFLDLGADEECLDWPVLYSSAKNGFAKRKLDDPDDSIEPLFEEIIRSVPPPSGSTDHSVQMLVASLDYSDYVGKIAIGRVFNGVLKSGQEIMLISRDGHRNKEKIDQVFSYEGLGRKKVDSAESGDIVALTGLPDVGIGDTITDPSDPHPLPIIPVDEPTLTMVFSVNTSPFAGKEGEFLTTRHIRDRLMKELQSNVALRVEDMTQKDTFRVSGRGLLHLGVLIESMRREGYELMVGKPKVIYREIGGKKCEPIEYLVVDVPTSHSGSVIELAGMRRGELIKMETKDNQCHLEFTIPARGLIGLRTRMLNATRGEAVMHHSFYEYEHLRGAIPTRHAGVMVAMETGRVTAYALENLSDRGMMFVKPGDEVYKGQVVGEHCKDDDIDVNVCRLKKMTNVRAASADKTVVLKPAREMSLEAMLEYIEDDEWVEATPKNCRMRKRLLDAVERKRAFRDESKVGG